MCWTTRGSDFSRGKRFLPSPDVHTDSGDHKTSYAMGAGGRFPEVKLSRYAFDHLYLVPRLGWSGDTPPQPYMPSQHGQE